MLVSCLLIASTLGLYMDQIGQNEWTLSNIGKITSVELTQNRKIAVSTDRGFLAVLRQNGTIEWRKLLHSLDEVVTFEVVRNQLIAYSGGVISAWSLADYSMSWSRPISLKGFKIIHAKLSSLIVGYNEDSVEALNVDNGATKMKVDILGVFKVLSAKRSVIEVAAMEGGKLLVHRIDVKTESISKITGNLKGDVQCVTDQCVVSDGNNREIYSEEGFHALDVVPEGNNREIYSEQGSHALESDTEFLQTIGEQYLLTKDYQVVNFSEIGVNYLSTLGAGHYSAVEQFVLWITKKQDSLQVTVLDTTTRESRTELIPFSSSDSEITHMWSFLTEKNQIVVFLTFSDCSFAFIEDSAVQWTRDESLAYTEKAFFLELPARTIQTQTDYTSERKVDDTWPNLPKNFIKRATSQIEELSRWLNSEDQLTGTNLLEKDMFGFNKIILLFTSPGPLFAIHSVTGKTIWKTNLAGYGALISCNQLTPNEFLIVTQASSDSYILTLDLLTGSLLSSEFLSSFTAASVLELDSSLVLVSKDLELRTVGTSNSTFYMYSLSKATGEITGYHYSRSLLKTWVISLPDEPIVAFTPSNTGKIHQPAIATGYSNVIYKYQDPNLFSFCTLKDNGLSIYVVNGLTGEVVSKVKQDHVSEPIHSVMYEHKVLTHYWNTRYSRYEISVVELFHEDIEDSAIEMIKKYLKNPSPAYSSFTQGTPVVFTQTYAFPTGIKAMKVTLTGQGITRPSLIMILSSNSVYSLNMNFLSARRHFEEDLNFPNVFSQLTIPAYNPVLPMQDTEVLSYFLRLEGLHSLGVDWTMLESTSVIAAYGVDLFVVRVSPETSFDMLTEDFSKPAILLTILGLVVLNLLIRMWVSRRRASSWFKS